MRQLKAARVSKELQDKLQSKPLAKQVASWSYSRGLSKQFKDVITKHLIKEQDRRCAYCTVRLSPKRNHRDHIAPKKHHPQFTFFSANLVLACYHCNSVCKLEDDTVSAVNKAYRKCAFSIVHPYFDKPEEHLQFTGGTNALLVQVVNNSAKGRETIRMFKLDDVETTKRRAMDVLLEKNLSHLPGPWIDTLEIVIDAQIYTKIRPAS